MEPEGSIPNSQELSTCSYPEPQTVDTKERNRQGTRNTEQWEETASDAASSAPLTETLMIVAVLKYVACLLNYGLFVCVAYFCKRATYQNSGALCNLRSKCPPPGNGARELLLHLSAYLYRIVHRFTAVGPCFFRG
jgi:hypothetical protein